MVLRDSHRTIITEVHRKRLAIGSGADELEAQAEERARQLQFVAAPMQLKRRDLRGLEPFAIVEARRSTAARALSR